MNYDNLLTEIKLLNNECKEFLKDNNTIENTEFEKKMSEKYNNIKLNFSSIYSKCIANKMDIEMITVMINYAKRVKKNKISNHDASVKVGEKLVDKFIKPMLKK